MIFFTREEYEGMWFKINFNVFISLYGAIWLTILKLNVKIFKNNNF